MRNGTVWCCFVDNTVIKVLATPRSWKDHSQEMRRDVLSKLIFNHTKVNKSVPSALQPTQFFAYAQIVVLSILPLCSRVSQGSYQGFEVVRGSHYWSGPSWTHPTGAKGERAVALMSLPFPVSSCFRKIQFIFVMYRMFNFSNCALWAILTSTSHFIPTVYEYLIRCLLLCFNVMFFRFPRRRSTFSSISSNRGGSSRWPRGDRTRRSSAAACTSFSCPSASSCRRRTRAHGLSRKHRWERRYLTQSGRGTLSPYSPSFRLNYKYKTWFCLFRNTVFLRVGVVINRAANLVSLPPPAPYQTVRHHRHVRRGESAALGLFLLLI